MREETSASIPSGHAQNGVAVWGYLAGHVGAAGAWIAAVLLMLLIGLGRVYLGVHYPQDVLGGYVVGIVLLWLYNRYVDQAVHWIRRRSLATQVTLAILLPLVALFLSKADPQGHYPTPGVTVAMGTLMGMSLGFIAESRLVRFVMDGSWSQRALRYLVGLVIVAVFWLGLRLLFAGPSETGWAVAVSLRFIRYATVGMASSWWAPWVFVRLGLARQR